MKNKFLIAVLALGIYIQVNAQTEKTVSSKIQHVTVFRQKAQITSTARTQLDAGKTTLIFDNIPADVDPQSIQVSGKGDVIILAVKHVADYLTGKEKSPLARKLEDSLTFYNSELVLLNSQKDVLSKEQQMIMANQNITSQQTGLTVERLQQMADFFRNRLTDIGSRIIKTDQALQKTNMSIGRIRNQLAEINNRGNRPLGQILVTVQAKGFVNMDVELNYMVEQAGWSPVYDLRAKDTKSPVLLAYKANVAQRTGIDWKEVMLTLSTGNPSQGGTKPELSPEYASIYQYQAPKKKTYYADNNRGMAERSTAEDMKVAPQEQDNFELKGVAITSANFTTVNETGVAASFDIALPYSVPADGKEQLVDIQQHDLPASYQYFAVPKLDPDAFLVAQVTGWEKYNLISGNANIYFEGTFVGESFLNVQNTNDTLNFSLGRDKKIIIDRKKITDFSSRKTIGSNIKETNGYKISVRNTKKEPITILIEDQVPLSQDSRIEVSLLEADKAYFNKETGKLMWKIQLDPAQTKELSFKFEIKYPKGVQVNY
jgi:uncharacterized protein (TIGR02231 family)